MAGVEDAVLQLTVQMSTVQQQIEDKSRRLAVVQQEIHATGGPQAVGGPQAMGGQVSPGFVRSGSMSPPSYEGLYPNLDVASISLEDAEWFQEGLPRCVCVCVCVCVCMVCVHA